jgi:flavin reductase (DIM6/NTAB) family NADH-FMN oxidoreductase RutF
MPSEMQATPSDYINSTILDAPVALLITSSAGRRNAMTLSFFSEVAHHPASLWISVRPQTLSHCWIEETGSFTLAPLHSGQAALAQACGELSGRQKDKTTSLDLFQKGGYWHLSGAFASIACRVICRRPSTGDHTLFIGEIVEAFAESRNPIRRHLLTRDLRDTG